MRQIYIICIIVAFLVPIVLAAVPPPPPAPNFGDSNNNDPVDYEIIDPITEPEENPSLPINPVIEETPSDDYSQILLLIKQKDTEIEKLNSRILTLEMEIERHTNTLNDLKKIVEKPAPAKIPWLVIAGFVIVITFIVAHFVIFHKKLSVVEKTTHHIEEEKNSFTQSQATRVKQYIMQNLRNGYPKMIIRQNLLSSGYSPKEIDLAFSQLGK